MSKRSIVGELINFRGLVYGPANEMGVVALFAKVGEELGFIIEAPRRDANGQWYAACHGPPRVRASLRVMSFLPVIERHRSTFRR